MQIGRMDEVITLQSLVELNTSGEHIVSYSDVLDVFGYVKTSKGSSALEAARENASEVIRVLIRYRDDVISTWRIRWNGQSYNILAIDRSNRREGELWITCELVGAI